MHVKRQSSKTAVWRPLALTFGDMTTATSDLLCRQRVTSRSPNTICRTCITHDKLTHNLDLLFCYKIVFGLVDVNFSDFFEFCATSGIRGHAYKLFKSHCNSGVRSQFFAERVAKFGIHCRLLLTLLHSPYSDRVSCVLIFPRFERFFLIFQFVSYCYLLYCLDTGTRLTTVFWKLCFRL